MSASFPTPITITKGDLFRLRLTFSDQAAARSHRVVAVSVAGGVWTLLGDVRTTFAVGKLFAIRDNTLPAANQVYTVTAVALSGANTAVTVASIPTGATASGNATRAENSPLDLSDYTITSQIRAAASTSGELLATFTVDDTDAADGVIVLELSAETTAGLSFSRAFWDVLLVPDSGDPPLRFPSPAGGVRLAEGVTAHA